MQKVFLRYLAYALGVLGGVAFLLLLSQKLPGGLLFEYQLDGTDVQTSEFSPVEMLQNVLLIFCGGVFTWIAMRDRLRRPMAMGFSVLFAIFLIRELDFFLDYYLMDNLWQVLSALVLSIGLVFLVRNTDRYIQGWRRSWPSAGLALIIGGLIILVPFAQLIGHEPLWESILGDRYHRVVKIAAEEFIELAAYALITMGTVEFLYAWSRLPRTRDIEPRPRRR
jgi:hypothetical protein